MYLIEGNSIKRKYSNKLQHEIIVYNDTIVADYDGEITFYFGKSIKCS